MTFHKRTSLAVKLMAMIVASANIIFIAMIIFKVHPTKAYLVS